MLEMGGFLAEVPIWPTVSKFPSSCPSPPAIIMSNRETSSDLSFESHLESAFSAVTVSEAYRSSGKSSSWISPNCLPGERGDFLVPPVSLVQPFLQREVRRFLSFRLPSIHR